MGAARRCDKAQACATESMTYALRADVLRPTARPPDPRSPAGAGQRHRRRDRRELLSRDGAARRRRAGDQGRLGDGVARRPAAPARARLLVRRQALRRLRVRDRGNAVRAGDRDQGSRTRPDQGHRPVPRRPGLAAAQRGQLSRRAAARHRRLDPRPPRGAARRGDAGQPRRRGGVSGSSPAAPPASCADCGATASCASARRDGGGCSTARWTRWSRWTAGS